MIRKTLPVFAVASLVCGIAQASSHREAPFIAELPKVDGTDFYMFRSYEPGRDGFVTFLANYQPLQPAYGGPNFFDLDPNGVYEILVDNNGDAIEDLTFQFRFRRDFEDLMLPIGPAGSEQDIPIPLINANTMPIGPRPRQTAGVNVTQHYSVTVVRGPRRTGAPAAATNARNGNTDFLRPLDNIGEKSIPDYDAYSRNHVFPMAIPGCAAPGRVFVGQRREGFAVNLDKVFDLVNVNPVGAADADNSSLANTNVTTIAMEVPIACLTAGADPVIGAWTTASLPRTRELRDEPTYKNPALESGDLVQVSRLGMPLVNEVVIGLPDKDRFNGSEPKNDAQFAKYVTNPTLPALLQVLFGAQAPTNFPRTDLVAAFLTGVPGLNQPSTVAPAEMLRLNTSIAAKPPKQQSNLGLLGGDTSGFPNGRRPGDDVVDEELRVAMGVVCHAYPGVFCNPSDAPAGTLPLTDGVTLSAADFQDRFPYLNTPVTASLVSRSD